MHGIFCSRCLDYNIRPFNEGHGLSNEDCYFGRTIWSDTNVIQTIFWIENISPKDIMLSEILAGLNHNTFNVHSQYQWRDKIIALVCLWSVTHITIMENILNLEVCYNQLAISSRQCINITHHLVWSVHNSKRVSQKFLCPTFYHGNTSIIFDNLFYCRTVINPIK